MASRALGWPGYMLIPQRAGIAGAPLENERPAVRGVYHAVSTTCLQNYLNEYAFRYNRRDGREPIFCAILGRVEQRRLAARPTGS
jgi:hypothetical protein